MSLSLILNSLQEGTSVSKQGRVRRRNPRLEDASSSFLASSFASGNSGGSASTSPQQQQGASSKAKKPQQPHSSNNHNGTTSSSSSGVMQPQHVPLWKQFLEEHERKKQSAESQKEARAKKQRKQQLILRHIAWTRKAQGLPPVFAIITGPTIRPYRMEELSILLGRVTPHHRDVAVHLGSANSRISRVHARLAYDSGLGCYCVINLSKNGLRVKHGDTFVLYEERDQPIPLANPAAIDIQGVLIYVQAFYVSASTLPPGPIVAGAGVESLAPVKKRAGGKRKRGGITFSAMIQTALRALGGAATQPEISDYIETHFVEDIADRKTWRNSVSGVLSSNPLFVQGGKKDRKSLWRLRGYTEEMRLKPEPEEEGALSITDETSATTTATAQDTSNPEEAKEEAENATDINTAEEGEAELGLGEEAKKRKLDISDEANDDSGTDPADKENATPEEQS